LHCFDVAARAGSFTAAAREMSLTHGAISRQVRLLEDELDTILFVRGPRRVTLTATGEALLATTERSFGALREGLAELRRRRGGPLVLSCEPTLSLHWLLPRLAGFQAKHPELSVHLESSGGPIDLTQRGVDLAIRRLDFPLDPSLHCTQLMDEWLGPVCSPIHEKHVLKGAPVTLLTTRTRLHAFRDWRASTGHRLPSNGERVFDHFAWSLQAAVAGLGVAMGPYPLVADALKAGRLLAPFGFVRGDIGYVLLDTGAAESSARTQPLRDWLITQARSLRPKKRELSGA
jgi:DNA-binding transcriptional LysR family regulator